MLRSLMAGVSGVKAHQIMLDVTGNNISNVNTSGFKKSTTVFQDLLYQTSRGATSPQGGRGGVNALQIGLGVQVAAVETLHTQGQIQSTGSRTDMAISGDGYYVVTDGSRTLFTRAGNFVQDEDGNLVQSGTGYKLQGYSMEPNPTDPTSYITGSTLQDINIPIGQKIPGKETDTVGFRCNLDGRVDSYLPMGVLGNDVTINGSISTSQFSINDIRDGTASTDFLIMDFVNDAEPPVTTTVSFSLVGYDVETGRPILSSSDSVTIGGTTYSVIYDSDSGRVELSQSATAASSWTYQIDSTMDFETLSLKVGTAAEASSFLVDFDDDESTGARIMKLWQISTAGASILHTATIPMNPDGTFNIRDDEPISFDPDITQGTAASSVLLYASSDGLSVLVKNEARKDVSLGSFAQRIDSTHNTKIDVYDIQGNPHTLEVSWEKIDNNQWRWRAWFPSEGVDVTPNTGILDFGQNGKISTPAVPEVKIGFGALGAEDATVKLDFSGESFNKDEMEGVTQYGSAFTTKGYYQDGYGMGVLNDFSVAKDGTVMGVYSNGVNKPISKVVLALFANASGLEKVGDTVFMESANSGIAQIVPPQTGGAGSITGSALEMSNVDLSEEFVRLIVAQRGFQASARIVTTSDQVLEELINLKR
jgi:flagellar hook protein FlgE